MLNIVGHRASVTFVPLMPNGKNAATHSSAVTVSKALETTLQARFAGSWFAECAAHPRQMPNRIVCGTRWNTKLKLDCTNMPSESGEPPDAPGARVAVLRRF